MFLAIVGFFQENDIAYRVSIRSAGASYYPSESDKSFVVNLVVHTINFLGNISTWLRLLLALRSTFIHMVIGWVFIIRFLDVAALGQPVGSLAGSIPTVFWTLGISSFDYDTGNAYWIYYGLFAIAVFILTPALLAGFIVWLVKRDS
jgi:hypothetical protein